MAKPFLKCLGGKAEMAQNIAAVLPLHKHSVYVEPFIGGGAVFFHLEEAGAITDDHLAVLGDADEHLIDLYAAVRDAPEKLHEEVHMLAEELAEAEEPDAYYRAARGNWNDGCKKPWYRLFLHRAAFNGLWRLNKKGEFNAAWCKKTKPFFPGLDELKTVSASLKGTELLDWDFRQYEDNDLIGPESCVYLDPPYFGGFAEYTAEGFSNEDQIELLQLAKRWEDRGAHVVYSNAPEDWLVDQLLDIWPTAVIVDDVEQRRSINRDGGGRGPVPELLAHSPMEEG
jgi:DNA adenine methylase